MTNVDRRFRRMWVNLSLSVGHFLSIALTFTGCTSDTPPDRALYEWRANVDIPDGAWRTFDSLDVERLYIRFFDVQWDAGTNEAVPRSTARFAQRIPDSVEIVPTIYVTNETVRRISPEEIVVLAERIVVAIDHMMKSARSASSSTLYSELQVDCDWTASSRTNYFALLDRIEEYLPDEVTLSATIRLHQIKYRVETGTPPVDRGTLMVYNTGEVTDPEEENSIISMDVVEEYVDDLDDYPLPLDVALPIFAWGVRFHFGRFAAIIPEVTAADLAPRKEFRQVAPSRFEVLLRTRLKGNQLEPGDIIRTEEANPQDVLPVAELITEELGTSPGTVILYRYDPEILARHETTRLLSIYLAFD